MNTLTQKLFMTHVVGLIVWMENAQNFFGMLGAVIGFCSAVMLVCINWKKFTDSVPYKLAAEKWAAWRSKK